MTATTELERMVDICNAALMEVGLEPSARIVGNVAVVQRSPLARRAIALGKIAARGPDALMTCSACVPIAAAQMRSTNCITAHEVLRGRTCGNTTTKGTAA